MTDHGDIQALLDLSRSPRNLCFACGPGNPCGLHLEFTERDGTVSAAFTPGSGHGGWSGVVHGGILTAALDEAMAYVLYFRGLRALTARLDVRFRHPSTLGETLTVEAHATRQARKLMDVAGRILRGDTIVAEATGRFMILGALTPEMLLGSG